MLIACPSCKKRFDVDPARAAQEKKLRCSNCRAVFRLVRKGERESLPGRLKVVIANESLPFCQAVQKVLSGEPFQLFICNDGKEALDTVRRVRPEILLLDVALPTMFGFEVCERVRQDPALSGTRIVLIASIYDKTRYKRSPSSLYGADDYIEKHHIPDALVQMIYRLTSESLTGVESPSASELVAQDEARSELRGVEVAETSCDPGELAAAPGESGGEPDPGAGAKEYGDAELKARRLARIIVSDIVLYNQAKVEQGVLEGNFHDLLADDIREGERLYRERVSEQVRESSSFLQEAFEEVIAKKRVELRS